uniref:Uncharacterized protein n=1 Tax=Aegilops tauschii subsp. strangulata TaxID=200361 RepID=A0A453RLA2_AEGTS
RALLYTWRGPNCESTESVAPTAVTRRGQAGARTHGVGGGAELAGGAVPAADADVLAVAAAAPGPGLRAEQVGHPRRAAQLPRVPAVVRARPLLPRRARRLVHGLPRAGARRARRRHGLPPRRRLAVPGFRVRGHVQPRGHAHRVGARRRLLRHAGRLLPPLRRPPAAAVPGRGAPRRHRVRPPPLRAGAGPRVPPPGGAAGPGPLRGGRAQGRLLLLHRARGAAAPAPARAVARGGAGGHGGVVGVPHGGVPAGVRAVPPHLRAPDPALRGDLPHVRRGGVRRRRRDLRGAPPHPDAAAGHQPPVQGVHHLLPRHHHRQPARRPARRPLLQGRQELRQLRRPPCWFVGAAEWVLHVPVRRGQDHAPSPTDRVHRQPVAHAHGVRRSAPRQTRRQHLGERHRPGRSDGAIAPRSRM